MLQVERGGAGAGLNDDERRGTIDQGPDHWRIEGGRVRGRERRQIQSYAFNCCRLSNLNVTTSLSYLRVRHVLAASVLFLLEIPVDIGHHMITDLLSQGKKMQAAQSDMTSARGKRNRTNATDAPSHL